MAIGTIAASDHERVFTASRLVPWSTAALVMWQIGAHIDVWYHLHHGFEIESFFTVPHALLYAGWAATGLIAALALGESVGRGVPRRDWLPPGYALILAGSVLFGFGGVFDLAWHSAVGFEARQEALLAPSHIWLVFAFMLCAFGLLQAAVAQWAPPGKSLAWIRFNDLPVILGVGIWLRIMNWFGTYAVPLSIDFASGGVIGGPLQGYAGIAWANEAAQIAGSMGILLQSAFLALTLVATLRWLRLSSGAILLIMLYEATLISLATDQWRYLPAVVGAALVAEALWLAMRRGHFGGVSGQVGYWLIGATTPFILYVLYFAIMASIGGGIIWTPHMWAGLPVVAAIVGIIVSVLAVPPAFIQQARAAADDARPA